MNKLTEIITSTILAGVLAFGNAGCKSNRELREDRTNPWNYTYSGFLDRSGSYAHFYVAGIQGATCSTLKLENPNGETMIYICQGKVDSLTLQYVEIYRNGNFERVLDRNNNMDFAEISTKHQFEFAKYLNEIWQKTHGGKK